MHSHTLPSRTGLRPAGRARRLADRTRAVVTQPSRRRPDRPWLGLEADPLTPGRAPGESYRDYLFRRSIRG